MIKIAFLGDFAIFPNKTLRKDWKAYFQDVSEELEKYDLVVINLETPITAQNRTTVCKGVHLKTSETMVDVLQYLHVGAVCLANNHICDFGLRGLKDTIDCLKNAGIPYYGINGKSLLLPVADENISLHGYCCFSANGAHYLTKRNSSKKGVNALTKTLVEHDLAEDKQNGHLSVLSFHWGDEYSQLPNEKQVKFVKGISSSYSFILHGHHTHAMQGIKEYAQSVAMFSQGNFCFDEVESSVNKGIRVLQNEINNESFIAIFSIENAAIRQWNTIGIMNTGEKIDIIDNSAKLKQLSQRIDHCEEEDYKQESRRMIQEQKRTNLGKKGFKWFIQKMNYYSIGAKLLSYRNNHLYKKSY